MPKAKKKSKKTQVENKVMVCAYCDREQTVRKGQRPKKCTDCGDSNGMTLKICTYNVTLHGVASVTAQVEVEATSAKEAMRLAKKEQENGDVWDWEFDGNNDAVEQLFTDESFVEEVT